MKAPSRRIVVAVDGPAAAGKGTIARRMAARFGLAHLDTGQIYRAVGARVLDAGGDPSDPQTATRAANALREADLAHPALRTGTVAQAASKVAAIGPVRAALLAFQRDFAANPPGDAVGAVLDGRDIGTVICPDADVKLFVTATPQVRAERRRVEAIARGEAASHAQILADVLARDARDSTRADAPMRAAPDALLLDTTALDIESAVAQAAALIEKRIAGALGI